MADDVMAGIRAERVCTSDGAAMGGGARSGLGARCPGALAAKAGLALVADAGTRWGLPAAVPPCCSGPFAYPNTLTAGRPLRWITGTAEAAGAQMAMPDEAAITSAAKRSRVRERAIMTPKAKIPMRKNRAWPEAGC